MASSPKADTVKFELGSRTVSVPKGGLYDRYRMNPNLDEIEADPRVRNVDFFRGLSKTKVDSPIGETYTPNFYYAMSSARLTLLAPSSAIRARLPKELSPLELVPGVGLVSVIFFRYDVADIDFYTEAAVGVAVRPARHGGLGAFDLITDLKNDHLHSYVFSLPVNTEIAQVRGHDGYGFPKWVTDLDVDINAKTSTARVANETGGLDVGFSAATPRQKTFRSGDRVSSLTSYTQGANGWQETFNQTNVLAAGSARFPRGVNLELGEGRMSDDIRALKPFRTLRLDVATESQAALHMPVTTSVRSN
ncbi:acetoacetate decarboxylase family protein [Nocardioides jejuensis]|uniref:Acetoacetate decarboxylase n=1 Tax=Nocardioides jejuensis TaxID=2502782 RepID=A0A4R1CIM6_9ACTN|nr:acetoacetate decarboxylase family protein [Nocardioides jejuensis]TCJ30647.1 acetoacetate decarboxylase [Nocardioides jejuensis]